MDEGRRDQPRPRGQSGHADERQGDEAHRRGADGDQDGGGERIEPHLDERVPAGVARGGKQNGGEDEALHPRNLTQNQEGRTKARMLARASDASFVVSARAYLFHSTSSTISISTGIANGSSAIPTAERACLPIASPKTSTIRS